MSSDNLGGTRRIGPPKPPCTAPEHNPAAHRVYRPGTYEHVCPICGNRMVFTVKGVTY